MRSVDIEDNYLSPTGGYVSPAIVHGILVVVVHGLHEVGKIMIH